jgi:SAM-dependent methyltransferase
MRRELLDLICCPNCRSSNLVVADASHEQEIVYSDHAVQEIEHGTVTCHTCAFSFPIQDYVLSFAKLLPPAVRADGTYWGTYYSRLFDYGIRGFLDTRSAPAPFLSMGVPQTVSLDAEEWGGPHTKLIEHPGVRPGGRVVDIGVGSGWSSLFLARQGFAVIAFDPSFELMQLAKRYAISNGIYLEYVCADMGNFHMRAESVDTVVALHSLHHVPDLEGGIAQIYHMLKMGGCLALDDHFQDALMLALLRDGLLQEANEHIFPALRDPALPHTPPSEHSENEGVGIGQLLPAIEKYLHIDQIEYRHIAFDLTGPLFYLQKDCNPEALAWATQVTTLLNRALQRTLPDMVEYVTLVAQKRAEKPTEVCFAPGPRDPFTQLHEHIALQQQEIEQLRTTAKELHTIVATKNDQIAYLEQLLHRIESGRLMRFLRWLKRTKSLDRVF